VKWTDEGCSLASLDDIAAMKLAAVAQRGSRKDIIDVYALALRHKPIDQLLSLYQKRYKIQDVTHVLYALNYFDDADKERTPTMLWDVNWRAVKAAMKEWIQETAL
jgi:predicted nucleotidyltransferase component of viral defense system